MRHALCAIGEPVAIAAVSFGMWQSWQGWPFAAAGPAFQSAYSVNTGRPFGSHQWQVPQSVASRVLRRAAHAVEVVILQIAARAVLDHVVDRELEAAAGRRRRRARRSVWQTSQVTPSLAMMSCGIASASGTWQCIARRDRSPTRARPCSAASSRPSRAPRPPTRRTSSRGTRRTGRRRGRTASVAACADRPAAPHRSRRPPRRGAASCLTGLPGLLRLSQATASTRATCNARMACRPSECGVSCLSTSVTARSTSAASPAFTVTLPRRLVAARQPRDDRILAGRHALEVELAARAGDRVEAVVEDLHLRDHVGVDVAVHVDGAGALHLDRLHRAALVEAEVEARRTRHENTL